MKPYKAPEPDGLQPVFFQKYWDIVGHTIFDLVCSAFESGTFPIELENTLIVLIPKETHPTTAAHFRPISLCNVAYKSLTMNRLI